MNTSEQNVICNGCPKLKTRIKNSGYKFGVDYVVLELKGKSYSIIPSDEIYEIANLGLHNFTTQYVPKFGKYEFEEYVGHALLEALFINKDLTDLLNSELSYVEYTPKLHFHAIKIENDYLREKVLSLFDIIEENEHQIFLKFKGEIQK